MKRWLLKFFFLLVCSPVLAQTIGPEEPAVSDGITKSDWLISFGGTNDIEHSKYLSTNAFTTNGTSTVTVNYTAHPFTIGEFLTIEDASTVDGLNMNGAWVVASVPNANQFTFTHTGTASGSSTSGTAVVTETAYNQDGKMRFQCYMTHSNYDDPIKFPGVRGAAHLHTFLGNALTDYASTYASLRGDGFGSCNGGPLNRSAYWFPAMIVQAGTKLKYPLDMQWYYVNPSPARRQLTTYRSPICATTGVLQDGRDAACSENAPYNVDQLPMRRLQRGQMAIFGYDPGKDGGAGGFPDTYGPSPTMLNSAWRCFTTGGVQQGGAYRYIHHRGTPSLGLSSNTSCPSDGLVQIRVVSPTCWTGQLDSSSGNSPHYEHFATHGNDGFGNQVCPATHPIRHLQFEVLLTFTYTGGISQLEDWWLSSDRHNGADFEAGTTWHWDMIFAWNDDILGKWSNDTMGFSPDANDPTTYDFLSNGENYAGGKHVRNFHSGGLGVDNIVPCPASWSAPSDHCALMGYDNPQVVNSANSITDVEVDIPANPGPVTGKSRMK